MQPMILDQKLKALVASERKITYEILLLLQTLDVTKSYRELGFSSLHEYLTKEIGYSEGAAHRRISSARLMKQVPAIEDTIKNGSLNLTQISLAQVAIRQEEKAVGRKVTAEQKTEVLENLKSKSTFETQRILKENFPQFELPKQKALSTTDSKGNAKVCVTMEFSEKDWERIRNLMAHFSHSVPNQKLESLLLYWCTQVEAKRKKQKERAQKTTSQKNIPTRSTFNLKTSTLDSMISDSTSDLEVAKADCNTFTQKATTSDSKASAVEVAKLAGNLPVAKVTKHRRIKSSVKVQIHLREQAQDQCQYVSSITGRRCNSKHFLEEEHQIPLAKGGTNSPENLRLFCRSHNQLMAKLWGISQY